MYAEILLIIGIPAILFGLARSTEKVLDIRQRQRDKGINLKPYL